MKKEISLHEVFFIASAIFFTAYIRFFIEYTDISYQGLGYSLLIVVIVVGYHFLVNEEKNYFRLDVLFLAGFLLVHFQWPAMVFFDQKILDEEKYIELWRISSYISYGAWVSLVALISWIFGYRVGYIFKFPANRDLVLLNYDRLMILTYVLFFAFCIVAGSNFFSGNIYKEGGSSDAVSGLEGYIYTLFSVSIVSLTASVIYNAYVYKNIYRSSANFIDRKFFVLIFAYAGSFLYAGDRGGPLQLIMVIGLLYGGMFNPIGKIKIFLLFLVIGVLMYVIGIVRAFGADGLSYKQADNFYDYTLALASSVRTLYLALDQVPNVDEYFYGKMWLGNILGLVPFLQRIFIDMTGTSSVYINSANYITYIRYGPNAHTGEGTTIVADIYLNFGLPGVIVFMSIFGALCKNIAFYCCNNKNYMAFLIMALFGGLVFYMARATYFSALQTVVWGLLIGKFFVIRG